MKLKKYIKNYRNNNLPETLFLVGVFVLSIGLFIEPQSTWFLGIHFYKSDLQTTTTIAKILGTVIISSSIILNLKKYTNKGNTQHNKHEENIETESKKNDESEKEPIIDINKTEAYLKKTGGFIIAVGWLTLVANAGFYLYYFFNKEIVLNSVYLLIFGISIILIILGKRIKNLNDINTKLYLNIVTILSLLFGITVVYSGGRIGLLFFFLIGYLVISLRKIHIAMKVKDFYSKLSIQKYKFNRNSWTVFTVVFLGLLTFFIIKDIKNINSIDWEKEYGNNEDLSYETYLKEKENSGSVWDEYDKQIEKTNTVKTSNNSFVLPKVNPVPKAEIANTNTSSWVTHISKEDGYMVSFPKKIECMETQYFTLETIEGQIKQESCGLLTYKNNIFSGAFSVSVYEIPKSYIINDDKDILDKFLNYFYPFTNENRTPSGMFKVYNGHTSLDVSMKWMTDTDVKEKIILVENKIYRISSFYPSTLDVTKEWEYFVNSFKLLNE